ncbi:hypothetical protein C1H46_034793 [Malus baccata]|uniref:Uncharacterized protein n=1 Tax=Malus baccata TaxID=106549 RepID=A0A540KZK9_MALBA|nr:hypothetical protein C1H46_034793 [Malus baccata]
MSPPAMVKMEDAKFLLDGDEKLHVLDELSISDLKSFIPELCSQLYFQVEQEAGIESIRLKALIDLFDEIVEPLFNQLSDFI